MASTPAAMAAAIGSRDGSGPMSGTGAGPETGLVAEATVDFACAAASFAADARSPLVSASPAAEGVLGGAFLAGAFFAAFFAGSASFAAFAGVFLGGAFFAGAFFCALAGCAAGGVLLAGGGADGTGGTGAGGSGAGGTEGASGADDGVDSAGGGVDCGPSSGRSCWSAIGLLLCSVVCPRVRQWPPSCQVGYGATRWRPVPRPGPARRPSPPVRRASAIGTPRRWRDGCVRLAATTYGFASPAAPAPPPPRSSPTTIARSRWHTTRRTNRACQPRPRCRRSGASAHTRPTTGRTAAGPGPT